MRKSTRGLITACAGLVAGAAFGAAPALAGPGWWPPGHVLGYYSTMSDCGGYANSLSLLAADYNCGYYPQRIASPYALVIQRPVQIVQPVVDYEPAPVADEPEPVADEPEPVADEPEPVADEPTGGTLADKPAKHHKANRHHKATKAYKAQNTGQIMSDDDSCDTVDVLSACDDAVTLLTVPVVEPIVPIVPLGGPVVVGGPFYDGPFGGPFGHHGGHGGGHHGGHGGHGGGHGGHGGY
ncbi:hypothetical protein [Actinoplanes subglobosus]|uniref:Uncharacterized protein n=1 Tax=Actinoplanes subglobosus TaxID=1547892 RepID=A0ABV8INC1_9ACTN